MATGDLDLREWLEPDRLGGFSMGTASGIRTRRYHSLLTVATTPPTGRIVLVGGVEVWAEVGSERIALSSHRFESGVIHPDGATRLVRFAPVPWPTWTYRIGDGDGGLVTFELVTEPSSGEVSLRWTASTALELHVRPLLAVRDYHSLTRQNGGFRFDSLVVGGNASWRPYPDQPAVTVLSTGRYSHEPCWYHNFLYTTERERGLDHIEDLAAPGVFRFALRAGQHADMVLRAGDAPYGDAAGIADDHRATERARRDRLADPLVRAADAYLVKRGDGLTVIAGYPWFTDWGRDTFISLRGLCLATGRVDEALAILHAWSSCVSEGMLPNRFPDGAATPEYNSVDASLWYVVAVGELLAATRISDANRAQLTSAVLAIIAGYRRGTRYDIHADRDGLIAAGVPGVQLTWMDAKIGDRVITPRIGKPVEIQALWINALAVGEKLDPELSELRERATASFVARFIRSDGTLFDVVDADHVPGRNDDSFRPNQVFAAGGLPICIVGGVIARGVVDAVEQRLWTPAGMRTLDPADPAYRAHYEGGMVTRDESYHQGTVWPWLAGPFVEAWLRAHGNDAAARTEARRRFFAPLYAQLETTGLGHLYEIADGDPPHTPRGTPFQAWSIAELIRIRRLVGDET